MTFFFLNYIKKSKFHLKIRLSMANRLRKIVLLVYKPIIAWNIFISLLVGIFFIIDGLDKPGGYFMAILMKPFGWISSVCFEKLFYNKNSYFFKNLNIASYRIYINIVIYDIAFFILIITICMLNRSFLLTVLPKALINKQY